MNNIPDTYRSRSPEQALAHLGEELGELIEAAGRLTAAIGKTQRFGPRSVNPELPAEQQEKNIDWVLREARDVVSAISAFHEIHSGEPVPSRRHVARLNRIAAIIEEVDRRAQFGATVTPTLREMTQDEMSAIYAQSKGQPEDWRPRNEESR